MNTNADHLAYTIRSDRVIALRRQYARILDNLNSGTYPPGYTAESVITALQATAAEYGIDWKTEVA